MNKWHLLPGMGANASMYDHLQRELDFEINFINWPKYKGEKTYSETANRVIEENDIEDGDVVGGSSLGGMVAVEIGRQKRLKAIVLIGSASSPAEVHGIISRLAPLTAISPISLIQILIGKHENIITKMLAEADSNFIRAMCLYLPKWSGAVDTPSPIFRIHGQKDNIIPCPKAGCEIIAGAGHLLAITNASECGEYLNKLNRRLSNQSSRQ
jgi:esterase/lipase